MRLEYSSDGSAEEFGIANRTGKCCSGRVNIFLESIPMLRRSIDDGNGDDRGAEEQRNFEKLLSIQGQLVSGQVFGAVYPALLDLASRSRVFLKEIDLKKVCRKNNKVFRFWLFNDCLIYGCQLESGQYLFHRKIDLITCSVMIYKSLVYKFALEVASAEKSFIVMAANEYEQMHWMSIVLEAIARIRGNASETSFLNNSTSFQDSRPPIDTTASPFWDINADAGTPPMSPVSSRCSDIYSEHSQNNVKDPVLRMSSKSHSCFICNEV